LIWGVAGRSAKGRAGGPDQGKNTTGYYLVQIADKNNDAHIDLDEAIQHKYGRDREFSESERARQAKEFNHLDTNNNSFLEPNEIVSNVAE